MGKVKKLDNPAPDLNSGATALADLNESAQQIMDQSPEVQEHAVQQLTGEGANSSASIESSSAGPQEEIKRDKDGVAFDPKIHSGTLLRSGKWRLKRSAGSSVAAPSKANSKAETASAAVDSQQAKAAALLAANSVFACGRMFGGEEWSPLGVKNGELTISDYDEKKMMEEAFAAYFTAEGVTEINPKWGLFLALSSYVVPRLQMPKTKERVTGLKAWATVRYAKWKVKRLLKKRGIVANVTIKENEVLINGSRADTWYDRERENDSRKEPSGNL